MLSCLGKILSRPYTEILFLFFSIKQDLEFYANCLLKLSPKEIICMKCKILFSGEKRNTIINLSSAELA